MTNKFETNPLKRFSNRVDNYIKYRPKYPQSIIDFFRNELKLSTKDTVADVDSGTGIFSEMLLQNGFKVIGIEPNNEMRGAAEKLLINYPSFISLNGTAESTNLNFQSVDFITAAQSFHWFDFTKTRKEFLRILKPKGWVFLIWNSRKFDSLFMKDYEKFLLKFSIDYKKISHQNIDRKVFQKFYKK
ncbi:MAG: class I SAM-dependent methyltransferase [Bacteroidetes bacterium]|nr:class I SAM-dependent methyltransferase [Bacteroidota bacterium]